MSGQHIASRRAALAAAVLLALGLSTAAAGQDHPNRRQGLSAPTAYHTGGIDSVNIFNGNLTLRIPLGQSYPVGGALSYGLTLYYNSNVWQHDNDGADPMTDPGIEIHNAGLGWRLSLGRMYEPNSPPNEEDAYVLIEPDGSRRVFYESLHQGEPFELDGAAGIYYTRDGSYLRARIVASLDDLLSAEVESPNGLIRRFDTNGRIEEIGDRFGNSLAVSYQFANEWRLTDQNGRTHKILFNAVLPGAGQVQSVELETFGSLPPAIYSFEYADTWVVNPRNTTSAQQVPLLRRLVLPDGSDYDMDYYTAYDLAIGPSGLTGEQYSGAIRKLILPTLGRYEWTYSLFLFNQGAPPFHMNAVEAVRTKKIFLEDGTLHGTREYESPLEGQLPHLPSPKPLDEVRRLVTSPLGDQTLYYFFQDHVTELDDWRHGLPFAANRTDTGSSPPLYLSVEVYDGAATASSLLRSTYVRYTADEGADHQGGNKRLERDRTRFHDDPAAPYADTIRSDFDGLGHYRTTTAEGNFNIGSNSHTTSANFNPGRGSYVYDANTQTGPTGSFQQLPKTASWVLNTLDRTEISEPGQAKETTEFCFDQNTGFLQRRRTWAGTGRSSNDLLAVFAADASGNLATERYYGGDSQTVNPGALCGLSLPANNVYGLNHTYQSGTLATSRYVTNGGGVFQFGVVDRDIDLSTGLVKTSRDVAGLATNFEYDTMGRLVWIKPEGSWTQLVHTSASVSGVNRTQILSRQPGGGGELAKTVQRFDGLGRLLREEERLPDGSQTKRDYAYNAMGWRTSVSERTTGTPNHKTQFLEYDPFGRPGRIRPSDGSGHDIVLSYDGVRRVHRTVKVATSTTGAETGQTTIEFYDRQGRLVRVREPSGAGGATVDTNYKYDAASRLREAKTTSGATQTRQFTYDGRGLLLWEKHPEKGAFGNGLVSYQDYDARGHAHRRIDNGHDLTFTYDRAERLTKVEETSPLRVLKQFTYSDVLGGSNHRRGKLVQAFRHNYLDLGAGEQDVVVTEGYEYRGIDGRISQRDTTVAIDGTSLGWTQAFGYTPLGDIGSVTYPCLSTSPGVCDSADPAPNRTVSYTYTSGYLTAVPGYANPITYHPSGALNQVVHANGASVTHGKDANDMVRPAWIGLPGTPILNYTFDGSGNVKAVGGETYAYDGVSRLKTAILSSGERHDYTYDAFGNLTYVDRTPNSLGVGDQAIAVSSSTNRLSTDYSYDGSGNLLATPAGQSYSYDTLDMVTSANDQTSMNKALYVYTADDERIATIRPGTGGDRDEVWRLRDLNGQVLRGWTRSVSLGLPDLIFEDGFETGDLSCWSYALGGMAAGSCPTPPAPLPLPAAESWSWNRDYVHREGLLLATVTASEGTLHYHLDHLGTPRSVTTNGATVASQHGYFPFGEETAGSGPGSADAMPLRFTGHERDFHDPPDFEEDVDYMHARYYRALYGRFLSVDLVGGRIRAPQSLNRYAYVMGNPLKYVDPYGLEGMTTHPIATQYPDLDDTPFWFPFGPPRGGSGGGGGGGGGAGGEEGDESDSGERPCQRTAVEKAVHAIAPLSTQVAFPFGLVVRVTAAEDTRTFRVFTGIGLVIGGSQEVAKPSGGFMSRTMGHSGGWGFRFSGAAGLGAIIPYGIPLGIRGTTFYSEDGTSSAIGPGIATGASVSAVFGYERNVRNPFFPEGSVPCQ